MSRQGEDRAAGFAAESLKGSGIKPSQSGGIHAEAGDHVLSNHSITGNEPGQDFAMAQNIPGTQQNPEGIPQEGHGGKNTRGTQHKQGKDGNGAQKREQEKKS
jgi:hypothetical protein